MKEIHKGMEHLGPLETIRTKIEVPIAWLDLMTKDDLKNVLKGQIESEEYEVAKIITEKLNDDRK